MIRYLFGKFVERDLRCIRDYIGEESPSAARLMMMRFVNAFRLLAKHPELGHVREDLLNDPTIRFWQVGLYLVACVAERHPIEIIAVVHGARDVPAVVSGRLE